MASPQTRRLSAILFTDMVGSSRITGADEDAGLHLRDRHRAIVREAVARYGGRLIEAPGDQTLSTFESALDAVSAALVIREAAERELGLALHTGIHLGETLFRGDEVFGDDVNIAARVCQLSPPGEIYASGEVANAIRSRPEIDASPRGEHKLRNIARTVAVFALAGTPRAPEPRAEAPTLGPAAARRNLRIALAAGAALALLGAVYLALEPRLESAPDAEESPQRGVIAVLPFAVRGADDLAYLREGFVELVSSKIALTDAIRPVDPHALLSWTRRELEGEITPEGAAEAARHFGAQHFVLGSALGARQGLHLEASLYATDDAREPLQRVALDGDADELLALVDRVVVDLTKSLAPNVGRFDQLETAHTRSPEALRALLEGNAAMRTWEPSEAIAAFERAVAADPRFGLAWYRLAWVKLWNVDAEKRDLEGAAAAMSAAAGLDLPPHERALFGALVDTFEGRLEEAEAAYRRLVRDDPEDWEAWNSLGELLIHYNFYRGRSISEAREPFARAFALDPGHPSPRVHLEQLGVLEDQTSWFRENVNNNVSVFKQAVEAYRTLDPTRMERVESKLRASGQVGAACYVLGAVASPEARARVLSLVEREAPPGAVQLCHAMIAGVELALGRLGPARAQVKAISTPSPSAALAAYGSAFPDFPMPRAEIAALAEKLERFEVPEDPLARAIGRYLLGLLDARLGRWPAVERAIAELQRSPGTTLAPDAPRELATSLRAVRDWTRGDFASALRGFLSLPTRPLDKDPTAGPIQHRVLERYLMSLSFEATGDLARAAGYLEPGYGFTEFLLAPCSLRRAPILARLGRDAEAIADYTRAVALWSDADDELQPRVERAAEALVALHEKTLPPRLPWEGERPVGARSDGIELALPRDVGVPVEGVQDDFGGAAISSAWTLAMGSPPQPFHVRSAAVRSALARIGIEADPARVFRVADGTLRVASALGASALGEAHLLLTQPSYDTSVQEVLARIRVVRFESGGNDRAIDIPEPRAGIGVVVDPTTSYGIDWLLRDEPQPGQRHVELLEAKRISGLKHGLVWQNGVWYWLRLRHEPNAGGGSADVFAKAWRADGREREPEAWQATWDYTSTRAPLRGLAGIAGSLLRPSEFEVDYVLVKAAGLPRIVAAPRAFANAADARRKAP